MPAVSQAQFKAMKAAQQGKSTLGISRTVGNDFVKSTKQPGKLPQRKPKEDKRK